MLLRLKLALERTRLTEHEFFAVAYYWKFNKVLYTDSDVVQFKLNGIIPKYVIQYLTDIGG